MHVSGAWSRPGIDEFLTAARVPVRLGCRTPGGTPWMLSLWYVWADGDAVDDEGWSPAEGLDDADAAREILCATSADADVLDFLRHEPEVSFEVSTNDYPYRGVRGRGTASIEPDTEKRLLRALFERYLGGTDNELGNRLLGPGREEVRIRVSPERLHSWDFSERMADVALDER
ncbi:pyridoxamine 5'-phosphate oxidase family protein [Halobellus sp. EA9]|uniref:pyridoxamine 5'-phosphate oxidase family protein n=1 Tax=Halobellus sp. EA9 TaxID=3421647 RepID=UPI003EBD0D8F